MDRIKFMERFADVIIKLGLNLQKGQILNIKTNVEAYEFARIVAVKAYEYGASDVVIKYNDDYISRAFFENVDVENIKNIPDYIYHQAKYLVDNNACMLSISSPNPGIMKGLDINKMQEYNHAYMKKVPFLREYSMNNKGQWCVVSMPNKVWADRVFENDKDAYDKLFRAIMKASRIDLTRDSLVDWQEHMKRLEEHRDILNQYNFKTLRFKNSLGTDLSVDLVENHIWGGGGEYTQKGIYFSPNMPTEEVFTMPHAYGVNGRVYSTKPLNYQGHLIENFYLDFKDGAVVNYHAEKEEAALKALLETDDGSMRLGEVALISYDSPISNMNILFYNTLFDENASCHLALGNAYTMNIKDGYNLSLEELKKKGYNSSMIHVDFMFGSKDLSVIGTDHNGKEIVIFKKGNFVF